MEAREDDHAFDAANGRNAFRPVQQRSLEHTRLPRLDIRLNQLLFCPGELGLCPRGCPVSVIGGQSHWREGVRNVLAFSGQVAASAIIDLPLALSSHASIAYGSDRC